MTSPSMVVFGTNTGALSVARHLHRSHSGEETASQNDILFADSKPENLEKVAQDGFATALADYMDDDDLRRIGIGSGVKKLFCLMRDESANVFLVLSARALDPNLQIIAVSETEHSASRLHAAGADNVISPHESTARRIYSILRKPLIVDLLEHTVFGTANLEVTEIHLPEGCTLVGQRLRELDIHRRFNLIPIDAIRVSRTPQDNSGAILPGARGRLQAGDILVVIGSAESVSAFRESLQSPPE